METDEATELKNIGLNIRKKREALGISRLQLAFEIETSEKQLSRIEYGQINSGIMSYVKIAKAFEVPLKDLFDF